MTTEQQAAYVSPLANKLKKASDGVEGIHFVLYGDPGSGKTSSLDDENLKVLILDMDKSTAVVAGSPNITIFDIDTLEEFLEACKLIVNGKWIDENGHLIPFDFDLVAADSMTRFEELVKDYVVRVIAPNRKREIAGKFGAMSDWGDLRENIINIAKKIHAATKRGVNSINFGWIAHSIHEKDEVTGELLKSKIKLQGKDTSQVIMGIVDAFFYQYKLEVNNEVEYGILTNLAGRYDAKVRQSKRQEHLPARIPNPSWYEIFKKLGYKVSSVKDSKNTKNQKEKKGDK